MKVDFWLIDAFVTQEAFSGNPAGVVVTNEPLPEPTMARIASEVNQAETAFVFNAPQGLRIRWFTPTVEVDLCGHATLASAHVCFLKDPATESLTFQSRSGPLSAKREGGLIWLDFPSQPPTQVEHDRLQALFPTALWRGFNGSDHVVVLADPQEVASYQPDFAAIAGLGDRGLVVTAQAEHGYVSRFFAPQAGVPEDHATGSSHTLLAPLWAARTGTHEFHARQLSPRGAEFQVRLKGDRVKIGGQTVARLTGNLAL